MAHTIRGDLNLLRGLYLDSDEGAAGQLMLSGGGATPSWADIAELISSDAGNDVVAGSDGKIKLVETVTSLAYNSGTTTLSFTNEAGNTTNIDLAALTTDIYVDGLTLTGDTLLMTDNNGSTPDVSLDLGSLRSALTDNSNGTYTHDDGSGSTVLIDTRDGISSDSGNDLTLGADQRPYFAETNTGLTISGTSLSYARESGAAQSVQLVAADARNRIVAGQISGKLYVPEIRTWSAFNNGTDWGSASSGLYTLTISAATFPNASADAMVQVQSGSSAPYETEIGLHSTRVNADGSVTLQVCSAPDGRFFGRVLYFA